MDACFDDLPEETKQIYRDRVRKNVGDIFTTRSIDFHASIERDKVQREIREKMRTAEAEGRRRGWDQEKINDWVSATIAVTDPENSFYQEIEAIKNAPPLSDEVKREIFGEEFYTSQEKWDRRFLGLAKEVASWSKDPSTKTGAVIVGFDKSIISVGFNGFARRVKDLPERYENRDLKYKLIVHCERNAIIFARRDLSGCTLYTYPFMSCSVCAGMVIQAGIVRCVAPPMPEHLKERWAEDMKLAEMQFDEAGVELKFVDVDGINESNLHV
jgi:dCMP deaminase